MFFRLKKGKQSSQLQLIESYRNESGSPRQKVLLSLKNTEIPFEYWQILSQLLEAKLEGKSIPASSYSEELAAWLDYLWVELQQKNNQYSSPPESKRKADTKLGALLVLQKAWDTLGLDKLLKQQGFSKHQAQDAAIVVFNRLLDAHNENRISEWIGATSFPELFLRPWQDFNKDRFYRIIDKLFSIKVQIEQHLFVQEHLFFPLQKQDELIYDLSHMDFPTYENEAMNGFQRGENKLNEQFFLGIVLDINGFLVKHHLFTEEDGSHNLLSMVQTLQKDSSTYKHRLLVLIDERYETPEYIEVLQAQNLRYIVVGKRKVSHDKLKYIEEINLQPGIPPIYISMRQEGDRSTVFCYRSTNKEGWGYYIKSNEKDFSKERIWKIYFLLQRVDKELSLLKQNAQQAAKMHRLASRSEEDIFITILAYHLLHWIEHTLALHGEYQSWQMIRKILASHVYKTELNQKDKQRSSWLRIASRPNVEQKRIYQIFGVDYGKLPKVALSLVDP